jgi:bromodomain-containing protein 7/9
MRLVTSNAKLFNPPGSIYYTEADRLEHWANDQIVKAATTVIEDGTDYDLNVEGDDVEEEHDEDDNLQSALPMTPVQEHSILETSPTAMVMDEDLQAIHAAAAYPPGRRPPQRAAVKKIEQERAKDMEKEKEKDKLTERVVDNELDDNDHMPGYKFGIGAFPAGDHWNEVMYALKLKGWPHMGSFVLITHSY